MVALEIHFVIFVLFYFIFFLSSLIKPAYLETRKFETEEHIN